MMGLMLRAHLEHVHVTNMQIINKHACVANASFTNMHVTNV